MFLTDGKNKIHYVCSACIMYTTRFVTETDTEPMDISSSESSDSSDTNESNDETRDSDDDDANQHMDYVLKYLHSYSSETVNKLLKKLGKQVVIKDFANTKSRACRTEEMFNLQYEDMWRNDVCPELRSFLEGIINLEQGTSQERSRKLRLVTKSVELLYMAKIPKYISSLSQAENLLLYQFTSSKHACNLFGRVTAGGTYQSLLKITQDLGKNSPEFPKGDIIVAYDNNQVIGKQYRVSYAGTLPRNIVTGITVFKEETEDNLQVSTYFPNVLREGDKSFLYRDYEQFFEKVTNIHRQYRFVFVDNRLKRVQLQLECNIEDWIEANELQMFASGNGLEYNRVPGVEGVCEMFDQECIMLNPNSEQTVTEVLDHIIDKVKKSDKRRKWVVLVQDGVPYTIALGVIRETRICQLCKTTTREIEDHMTSNHPGRDSWSHSQLKYTNLVLRPGNGHYEINLVRAIFSTFFDVYIAEIAKMLGFRTPRSLEYCRSAADHHKSFQILQILYESLTDELLRVYVKQTSKEEIISAQNYFLWYKSKGCKNPNYAMAFDFTFSVLHPLFLFRAAIRQCNDEVSLAAREKAAVIFYGFNHPKYREINANDVFYLLTVPSNAQQLVGKQSLRRPGGSKGEGVDFLQEYRNKIMKNVLPWDGVPSEKQWKRASCSVQKLEKLRESTMERIQMTEEDMKQTSVNLDREVFEAQRIIREWGYFERFDCDVLVCLGTEKRIHLKFGEFLHHCEKNQTKFYKGFLNDQTVAIYPIVPFSSGTTDKPINKSELQKNIRRKIKALPHPLRTHYTLKFKKVIEMEDLINLDLLIEEEFQDIEAEENQL